MTVFEELTKGMKFSGPVEDIKKNMVKVFEKNFRCPPWNDVYEEGWLRKLLVWVHKQRSKIKAAKAKARRDPPRGV